MERRLTAPFIQQEPRPNPAAAFCDRRHGGSYGFARQLVPDCRDHFLRGRFRRLDGIGTGGTPSMAVERTRFDAKHAVMELADMHLEPRAGTRSLPPIQIILTSGNWSHREDEHPFADGSFPSRTRLASCWKASDDGSHTMA